MTPGRGRGMSILWPIIDPILVIFGQMCNFHVPNLVTFYFYELTHFLDWMKNTLLFICSTNILVHLLTVKYEGMSYPKKSKNVRPHSSNSIENAPHSSHTSRENATPSSNTSPLASYKEVLPSPPPHPLQENDPQNND